MLEVLDTAWGVCYFWSVVASREPAHPEVAAAGVRDDLEVLRRGADRNVHVVLGILVVGNGDTRGGDTGLFVAQEGRTGKRKG